MRTLTRLVLVSVLCFFFASSAHGGDEIVVIVNKEINSAHLNRNDLRPIFQTTKTSWLGGKALPLNLPPDDSSRRGFDAAVMGLDPDRVARYWIDRKIRGGNAPPKNIPSAAVVLKIVAARKDAIGYVPLQSVTKDVRIVAKIRGGDVVAP